VQRVTSIPAYASAYSAPEQLVTRLQRKHLLDIAYNMKLKRVVLLFVFRKLTLWPRAITRAGTAEAARAEATA
jgi:hypothetical protein